MSPQNQAFIDEATYDLKQILVEDLSHFRDNGKDKNYFSSGGTDEKIPDKELVN